MKRSSSRLALAAVLTLLPLLALSAAASAAAPTLSPRPARTLAGGWRLGWPLTGEHDVALPGTRIGIATSPPRGAGRDATATVQLVRLAAPRRPERVVITRRVRSGTTWLTLPQGAGTVRYRLVFRAGRAAYGSEIRTLPPGGVDSCSYPQPRAASATLTSDRSDAANGETITLTIHNTGKACLAGSEAFSLFRLDGGLTTPIPSHVDFVPDIRTYPVGSRRSSTFRVLDAAEMPAGEYRIVQNVWSRNGDAIRLMPLTVTFRVRSADV